MYKCQSIIYFVLAKLSNTVSLKGYEYAYLLLFYIHMHVLLTLHVYSTAQLLEPFCREHDIRVLGGDLDRQTANHPGGILHQTTGMVITSDLEDPPGLYEKVTFQLHYIVLELSEIFILLVRIL